MNWGNYSSWWFVIKQIPQTMNHCEPIRLFSKMRSEGHFIRYADPNQSWMLGDTNLETWWFTGPAKHTRVIHILHTWVCSIHTLISRDTLNYHRWIFNVIMHEMALSVLLLRSKTPSSIRLYCHFSAIFTFWIM